MPKEDKTLNLTFTVEYVQADDTVVMPTTMVCKRATTLHTEECTHTYPSDDGNYYCGDSGYTASGSKGTTTITYGNLGTKGVLNSGDAFDCDVNNDGTYDSVTERFYYVSPAYEDGTYSDEYVALIYYNNTTAGVPDNTESSFIAYNSAPMGMLNGPKNGYRNLPSISQWSNPDLESNMTRQIRTEKGTTSTVYGAIQSFTYTDKAARFLTSQEVNKACNITVGSRSRGELDSCNYLMENTRYSSEEFSSGGFLPDSYWLESPAPDFYSDGIWIASGWNSMVEARSSTSTGGIGVRPVITVLKSKISY